MSDVKFDAEVAQAKASEAWEALTAYGWRYRHYKGGIYFVFAVTVDESTGNVLVHYASKSGDRWTRTYDNFTGLTDDGRKRFEPAGKLTSTK